MGNVLADGQLVAASDPLFRGTARAELLTGRLGALRTSDWQLAVIAKNVLLPGLG